jgi:hypothetical protein
LIHRRRGLPVFLVNDLVEALLAQLAQFGIFRLVRDHGNALAVGAEAVTANTAAMIEVRRLASPPVAGIT